MIVRELLVYSKSWVYSSCDANSFLERSIRRRSCIVLCVMVVYEIKEVEQLHTEQDKLVQIKRNLTLSLPLKLLLLLLLLLLLTLLWLSESSILFSLTVVLGLIVLIENLTSCTILLLLIIINMTIPEY